MINYLGVLNLIIPFVRETEKFAFLARNNSIIPYHSSRTFVRIRNLHTVFLQIDLLENTSSEIGQQTPTYCGISMSERNVSNYLALVLLHCSYVIKAMLEIYSEIFYNYFNSSSEQKNQMFEFFLNYSIHFCSNIALLTCRQEDRENMEKTHQMSLFEIFTLPITRVAEWLKVHNALIKRCSQSVEFLSLSAQSLHTEQIKSLQKTVFLPASECMMFRDNLESFRTFHFYDKDLFIKETKPKSKEDNEHKKEEQNYLTEEEEEDTEEEEEDAEEEEKKGTKNRREQKKKQIE